MADVKFVFGDILTGQIIDEIPLYGVSMAKAIASGEFRGSFQLDQTGKNNATLLAATIPGRCYVVCERNNSPIWGGVVWTRTYQSQAKVSQLYCRGIEHYPERRLIRDDFEMLNTEQLNIFRALWQDMLADANSIQVVLPASYPNITLKSVTVKASEFKTYRQVMDELASSDDGFDWTVDVGRQENAYTFTLRIGFPYMGSQNPDAAVHFDYPGSITNYWQNDSMSGTGTHIFGIGAGEGSTMPYVEVEHADLVASGFPRYDVDVAFKSIRDLDVLTGLTVQAATLRRAPGTTLTVETKADKEPAFGNYNLGDLAVITLQDPRHPNVEDQIKSARIIGWEYKPASSDSVEMSRLVFEGDDL